MAVKMSAFQLQKLIKNKDGQLSRKSVDIIKKSFKMYQDVYRLNDNVWLSKLIDNRFSEVYLLYYLDKPLYIVATLGDELIGFIPTSLISKNETFKIKKYAFMSLYLLWKKEKMNYLFFYTKRKLNNKELTLQNKHFGLYEYGIFFYNTLRRNRVKHIKKMVNTL